MAKTSGLTSFSCNTHTTLAVQDHQGGYYCYNCVIETYQTQVYHLARHILNDWALAEDAVQEGFTAGFRTFGKFRGDNLKAWITQIVVNVCRDMLRASKSRSAVSLDRLSEGPSQDNPGRGGMDFPSRDESPEEYAKERRNGEDIPTEKSYSGISGAWPDCFSSSVRYDCGDCQEYV